MEVQKIAISLKRNFRAISCNKLVNSSLNTGNSLRRLRFEKLELRVPTYRLLIFQMPLPSNCKAKTDICRFSECKNRI